MTKLIIFVISVAPIIRASEGTLSRWSRLHSQSLAHPLQFQGGLASGRRPVVNIIAESLSQHDEKHVVPTPFSGIRIGRRSCSYNESHILVGRVPCENSGSDYIITLIRNYQIYLKVHTRCVRTFNLIPIS
jgi:hypothetical protein